MIRVPDWAFEAAGQETRVMGQDTAAYHPGLYLTPAQVSLLALELTLVVWQLILVFAVFPIFPLSGVKIK